MRTVKLGQPPTPPPSATPYEQALYQYIRDMVVELEIVSEVNDRPTPYSFTINDLGTNTLRTLSSTNTSVADLRNFSLTATQDLKNKGLLR